MFELLRKYDDDDDPDEVISFVYNTISDIDGSHEGYIELLDMLRVEATEAEVCAHKNEPDPPILPTWFRKLFGWASR
ncbi:MAG: hypothetical protein ACRBCJ_13620 [Hyphomicrobiaceae bacterium]